MSERPATRLARASDVETIHRLLQHLADSTGLRHKFISRPEDFLKFGFCDDPKFEVLLAEPRPRPIRIEYDEESGLVHFVDRLTEAAEAAFYSAQGEVVVGLCLFFYNFSSWRGELGVYIQDLVVDSDVRASGIGRLLVRETARYAVGQGATHLRLSVDRDNHQAMRFYEKIGLQESADENIFAAYDGDFVNLVEAV